MNASNEGLTRVGVYVTFSTHHRTSGSPTRILSWTWSVFTLRNNKFTTGSYEHIRDNMLNIRAQTSYYLRHVKW